jgi:DNA-binding LacI/PurR family transcriptional regulator
MPKVARLKQTHAREAILDQIRMGHFRPGQRLPSERQLAIDLSLSHITVRRGLEDLVDAGVIVKRPRVGNFVQQIRSTELSQRVAIVLPRYMQDSEHPHPVTALVMKAVMGEMDQRDYAVSLISYHYQNFWLDAGEAMLARGIKGALIWADADIPAEQMRKLAESGIKVVLLNGIGLWPELKFSSASVDIAAPMREALERLTHLGHRRIAWLTYDQTRYRSLEEELVREYSERYALGGVDQVIYRIQSTKIFDYGMIADLFDRRVLPTAMILQDEFIAHEVFRQCHQRGIRVPEDLSLVAITDSTPQAHLVPLSAPHTSAAALQVASKAAEHLKYMLESENPRQMDISLSAPIQWKQSTAPPADLVRMANEGRS